jgi:hypothetical protein
MGWGSGSILFSDIIRAVSRAVPDKETRKRIYRPIIDAFEQDDWDTQDECLGKDIAYDELYEEVYGDD